MKKIIAIVLFLFISLSVSAQKIHRCMTNEYMEYLKKKNPNLSDEKFEKWMHQKIEKTKYNRTQRGANQALGPITIPVVVHIVHIGEEVKIGSTNLPYGQVESQIRVLNEDYNGTNADRSRLRDVFTGNNPNAYDCRASIDIQFKLAEIGPNGEVLDEPGVDRIDGKERFGLTQWKAFGNIEKLLKPATSWDTEKYLNIWVVTFEPIQGGTLLGYAHFPLSSGLTGIPGSPRDPKTDGLVINFQAFGTNYKADGSAGVQYLSPASSANKGRTTTHEMGHFLGLRHIWGDNNNICGSVTFNDYCKDTPYTSEKSNASCNLAKNTCTNIDPAYGKDTPDMIENYMDYSGDKCMSTFTKDQVLRMETVIQNSDRIKELPNSKPFFENGKVYASFKIPSIVEVGAPITFEDNSVGKNTFINSYQWNFDADGTVSTTNTFTGKNPPPVTYNKAGIYKVKLRVIGTNGATSTFIKEVKVDIAKPFDLTIVNAESPTILKVENEVQLAWKLNSTIGIESLKVYRINPYTKAKTVAGEVNVDGPYEFTDNTFPIEEQLKNELSYNYKVVASGNGIQSETKTLKVTVVFTKVTAIDEKLSSQVQVYPNPTKDILNVDLSAVNQRQSKAVFYNSLGKPVATYALKAGISTLNTDHLASGLYLLVVDTEQGTIRKRVMIK